MVCARVFGMVLGLLTLIGVPRSHAGFWNSYDPTALFVGTQVVTSESGHKTTAEVVGFFKDFKVPRSWTTTVELVLFEVSAKTQEMPLEIRFQRGLWDSSHLRLEFSSVLEKGTELRIEKNSAHPHLTCGTNEALPGRALSSGLLAQRVNLCYSVHEIKLNIRSQEGSRDISLQRGGEVASLPFDNRVSRDLLVGRARFLSPRVRKKAIEVFQKRRDVDIAAANIAPRINARTIFEVVTGFIYEIPLLPAYDLFTDLCPWVFPAHRQELGDAMAQFKELALTFRDEQADQMLLVENLYFEVLQLKKAAELVRERLTAVESAPVEGSIASLKRQQLLFDLKKSMKDLHFQWVEKSRRLAFEVAFDFSQAPRFEFLEEPVLKSEDFGSLRTLNRDEAKTLATTNSRRVRELGFVLATAGENKCSARFRCCQPEKGIFCTLASNPFSSPESEKAEMEEVRIQAEIQHVKANLENKVDEVVDQLVHLAEQYEDLQNHDAVGAVERARLAKASEKDILQFEELALAHALATTTTYYGIQAAYSVLTRLTYQKAYEPLLKEPLSLTPHFPSDGTGDSSAQVVPSSYGQPTPLEQFERDL